MEFVYNRSYRGPLKAVILDWAGTTMDYGCYAPAVVFIEVFKRKKEWFSKLKMMHMVFWFVQAGHTPTPEEAKACLNYINTHGETPYAFTFKSKFISNEFLAYKKIA